MLSGITVYGNTENDVVMRQCSDVRIENCTLKNGDEESVPTGILVMDGSSITVSKCSINGCGIAIFTSNCHALTVTDCDISDIGNALCITNCEDVLVRGCALHDCWREAETLPDEPQGDASYLINVDGQSKNVSFTGCEIYGNQCTFLFGFYNAVNTAVSNVSVHDNDVDDLFCYDEFDEPGNHEIWDCEFAGNKIGSFIVCMLSETKVKLSGRTMVRDNEIKHLFRSGDITISEWWFQNNQIDRYFGADEDSEDGARVSVHDPDGNELGEAEIAAMRYESN